MGVFFHQDAVVVRAGLRLVGVDAQVDRARVVLREEGPLQPGGETRAAPAAQARVLHAIDDFFRLQFGQRPLKRGIPAVDAIPFQPGAVGLVDSAEQNRFVCHESLPSGQ